MTFTPGSDAALDAGCTCPVMDNGHGRGAWTNAEGDAVFWHNADCPLHGCRVEKTLTEGVQ